MNTPSIIVTVFLSFFLSVVSKKYVLVPFIAAACFIPMKQRMIVSGLDFTTIRILIIVGILRILLKGEKQEIEWNVFDKLILIWSLTGSFIYIFQHASSDALVNRLGVLYDTLGLYWIARQTLRKWEDIFQAIKIFAFFAIITAPLIAYEKFQETSLFTTFGGTGGQFHYGRYRANGPFPHSIIMGCFWATLMPLFYARIKTPNSSSAFYWLAVLSCLLIVFCSASSTSVMTVLSVILFWNIYRFRASGKSIFISTCIGLFILDLIMRAPVWHLMSRINVFSGSTGWHRYHLFDRFIRNTTDWFFIGTPSTAHWGRGLSDITNQFVLEGVRGGMVTLLLFIVIVYLSVKIPGRHSLIEDCSSDIKILCWGFCVSMFSHFVTFWGVSYFGQIKMLLYFSFAIIASILDSEKEIERLRLL